MPRDRFDNHKPYFHDEPIPPPDDEPTDEEITDAIMREMDIQQLPREEVLRTVREFFRGKARKAVN